MARNEVKQDDNASATYITLIAVIIFIVLRTIVASHALANDGWLLKTEFIWKEFPYNIVGAAAQPPLMHIPQFILASILGSADIVFRLPMIISAIGVTLITFFVVKKKQGASVASIAALLIAALPWAINASTNALQTSQLTLYSLIALLLAQQAITHKNNWWIISSAIVTLFAFLTMLTAIVVPITICVFFLLNNQSWREKKQMCLKYGTVLGVLITVSFSLIFFMAPDNFTSMFSHAQALGTSRIIPVITLMPIMILFLWIGPFSVLVAKAIPDFRKWTKDIHILFVLVCCAVFFLINSDPARPFDRYFMIAIPSLILIISTYLSDEINKFVKSKKALVSCIALIIIMVLIPIVIQHHRAALEPKESFIITTISTFGLVDIPMTSNGGPVGFYVPGAIFIMGWGLAIFFSVRKKSINSLIAVVLAFGVVMSMYQTGILGDAHPDAATDKLIEILPTISIDHTLALYRNPAPLLSLNKDQESIIFSSKDAYSALVHKTNITIAIVEFPLLGKDHQFWQIVKPCAIIYADDSFGVPIRVYSCEKTSE